MSSATARPRRTEKQQLTNGAVPAAAAVSNHNTTTTDTIRTGSALPPVLPSAITTPTILEPVSFASPHPAHSVSTSPAPSSSVEPTTTAAAAATSIAPNGAAETTASTTGIDSSDASGSGTRESSTAPAAVANPAVEAATEGETVPIDGSTTPAAHISLGSFPLSNTTLIPNEVIASASTSTVAASATIKATFHFTSFPPVTLAESFSRTQIAGDPEADHKVDVEFGYAATPAEIEASRVKAQEKAEAALRAKSKGKGREVLSGTNGGGSRASPAQLSKMAKNGFGLAAVASRGPSEKKSGGPRRLPPVKKPKNLALQTRFKRAIAVCTLRVGT